MKAKAPMTIDDRRGRRFPHNRPLRTGNDMPDLDAVDIGRDRDHAMRIVAREVGVDATGGHGAGFLIGRAGGLEQRRADARETVGLDDRHGGFLFSTPARAAGLASCGSSVWSQSDRRLAMT